MAINLNNNLEQKTIESYCNTLYNSTAGRIGTDENAVFDILNNSDDETLVKIMDSYSSVTGSELFKDIQNDFSGKTEKSLISKLEDTYLSVKGAKYTGDNDGLLNNKQKL